MDKMREACYSTLVYFDLFDFPLNFEEIRTYFLGKQPAADDLKTFLDNDKNVGFKDGFYFLKGRENIVAIRKERNAVSELYWKKARFFLGLVRILPFIKMIAVCNTLAFHNATKNSDIDLFIVAKEGRLFIVRFLTVFLFSILGVRRHGEKIAGRFCLSFYVTDEFLNLKPVQLGADDIYLPFWIITLRPVCGLATYKKFLSENAWASEYFGGRAVGPGLNIMKTAIVAKIISAFFEFLLNGKLGSMVEEKLRKIQFKRHQVNLSKFGQESSIIVTEKMLKFHNVDKRHEIARKFKTNLRNLCLVTK